MRLPAVLLPGHLPLAELCAARLDGEVVGLDEGFLVADLPLGVPERLAALAAILPRGAVADRLSAAWVYGALHDPPQVHSASVDRRHRLRPPLSSRLRCHEVLLDDGDVLVHNDTAVTTAVRTLIDLARTVGGESLIRAVALATQTGLEAVLARLENGGPVAAPHRIERRLRAALSPAPPGAQPALTR
ncbi:hypothetical protein ACVLV4_001675 [Rathayibacter agropyri]